jgi:uncharacterized protein
VSDLRPGAALLGGALVALGLLLALVAGRRVVGVSGVVGGIVLPSAGDTAWRVAFLIGLLVGGVLLAVVAPGTLTFTLDRSLPALAVSGLLVGFGTRLGNGCTSGHGVCGVARLSRRSLVATATFVAAGAATVFAAQHLIGGS